MASWLTCGHVVAPRDQLEHLRVHFDEPVLGERLLLLPVDEGLRDLPLEVVRLDCVDDLQSHIRRYDLR
jgi:hypothetical protein